MEAIKRIISKDQFNRYDIPDNFAEKAEVIILPYIDQLHQDVLSEDEEVYSVNNDAIIEENEEEDKIWRKYL